MLETPVPLAPLAAESTLPLASMVMLALVKLPAVATVASVVGMLEVPVPVTSPVRAIGPPPPMPEGPMIDTVAVAKIAPVAEVPLTCEPVM